MSKFKVCLCRYELLQCFKIEKCQICDQNAYFVCAIKTKMYYSYHTNINWKTKDWLYSNIPYGLSALKHDPTKWVESRLRSF